MKSRLKIKINVLKILSLFVAAISLSLFLIDFYTPKQIIAKNNFSERNLLQKINTFRKENKANPLLLNGDLSLSAQNKITDIDLYNYLEAKNPYTGNSIIDFVSEQNYSFNNLKEIISFKINDESQIFNSWLEDENKRKYILEDSFDEIGIASRNVELEDGVSGRITIIVFADKLITPDSIQEITTVRAVESLLEDKNPPLFFEGKEKIACRLEGSEFIYDLVLPIVDEGLVSAEAYYLTSGEKLNINEFSYLGEDLYFLNIKIPQIPVFSAITIAVRAIDRSGNSANTNLIITPCSRTDDKIWGGFNLNGIWRISVIFLLFLGFILSVFSCQLIRKQKLKSSYSWRCLMEPLVFALLLILAIYYFI